MDYIESLSFQIDNITHLFYTPLMHSRALTIALTTLAMIAFASNSLLNRLALGQNSIDAISYTAIRLTTGAIVLWLISVLQKRKTAGNWISAAMLFTYAIAFSFAYLSLSAGTGALILFGSVQVTMILAALRSGERPHLLEWSGILLAVGGLVYLVFPGLRAPSPLGSALMVTAGIAWGIYSLRGRGVLSPLASTAGNFIFAVPMILMFWLPGVGGMHVSRSGILVAAMSGAIASGVGYVIWYAALPGLTATRAAMVQLSVPVLAGWAGVVFLAEDLSLRLVLAGALILGGIAIASIARSQIAATKN